MTINVSELLYVESEGNYLRVVCKSEERKIRLTLKQFLSESDPIPEIIPSHRAYVLNLLNVSYYEGSSRKGEVHFHGRKDTVPVSRNHVRTIIDSLSNLH